MKLQQVSESCFAVLNEKNLLCDANSGLINLGGGVVVDTQSDLPHGRRMIELFGKVWRGMLSRVVNTHEDVDHDSAPTDMRMDGFMVTLVFGWHPVIEGMRRLKSE